MYHYIPNMIYFGKIGLSDSSNAVIDVCHNWRPQLDTPTGSQSRNLYSESWFDYQVGSVCADRDGSSGDSEL